MAGDADIMSRPSARRSASWVHHKLQPQTDSVWLQRGSLAVSFADPSHSTHGADTAGSATDHPGALTGHQGNAGPRRVSGNVHVRVVKAEGLLACDRGGTSDPYVVVRAETNGRFTGHRTTGHRLKTLNPVWGADDKNEFDMKIDYSRALLFSVFDHDQLGRDDLCGDAVYDISALADGETETVRLILEPQGRLFVELRLTDESDLFGMDLDAVIAREHGNRSGVPTFVTRCIREIEARGLRTVGLYRVCGERVRIDQLRAQLDHNADIASADLSDATQEDLTSLLKEYLRCLPDPLLTRRLHASWIEAAAAISSHCLDVGAACPRFAALLASMPEAHRTTTSALMEHLVRVAAQADVNKMNECNLAVCFGPSIMDPPSGMAPDPKMQVSVVEFLIAHWSDIVPLAKSTDAAPAVKPRPRRICALVATHLTDSQEALIRGILQQDSPADGGGKYTRSQVDSLIKTLGFIETDELKSATDALFADGKSAITFDECKLLLCQAQDEWDRGKRPPRYLLKSSTKRIYEKFDTLGKGVITYEQFRKLCYDLGYSFGDEEFAQAVQLLDINSDNMISFREFELWWHSDERFNRLHLDERELHELQSAIAYFRHFDEDRNGTLTRTEFAKVHQSMLEHGYAIGDVDTCIAQASPGGSGAITLNQFVNWLIDLGALRLRHRPTVASLPTPS